MQVKDKKIDCYSGIKFLTSSLPMKILLFSLMLVFVMCLYIFLIHERFPSWTISGTFGDTFGALNALFTGLAAGGAIYTLYIQQIQLRDAQQEQERLSNIQSEIAKSLINQAEIMRDTFKVNLLNILPIISLSVSNLNQKLTISISNLGAYPGFNINILVLGIHYNSDTPTLLPKLKHFAKMFPSSSLYSNLMQIGIHDTITLLDQLIYVSFPPKKRVDVDISFEQPVCLNIMFQFLDIQGKNFQQVYSFAKELNTQNYKLTDLQPPVIKESPRLIVDEMTRTISSEDGSQLSDYLNKEVCKYLSLSFPVNYLNQNSSNLSERGTWSDL
jgi:hypothetical protein